MSSLLGDLVEGIELDWLGFFRAVNTSVTAPASMSEILDVQQLACGGACAGKSILFENLSAAAKTYWGQGSPEESAFTQAGNTYGIDR